ncbi:hypothetical protein BJX96DRAFT_178817 [Aspergillus floccosus]
MAAWLGLERGPGGWTVVESDRMRHILALMDRPSACYPSVQLFIGRQTKMQALRSLHPHNNWGRYRRQGFARLHLSSIPPPKPVWIVEAGDSEDRGGERGPSEPAREPARRHHLPGTHEQSRQEIHDLLLQRLLFPVADTVCVFPADLGGVARVREHLKAWSAAPLVNVDGSQTVRPQLVVVLTDPDELAGGDTVGQALTAVAVPHVAVSVAVVDLRGRSQLSAVSRFAPLRQCLLQELDAAQAARSDAHLSFSAVHLDWMLRKALVHLAQRPQDPFDGLRASRPRGITNAGRTQALREFFCVAARASFSPRALAAFVASALLMDAYPPGMHGFHPVRMFRSVYAAPCRAAYSNVWPAHADGWCQRLEGTFESFFATLSATRTSAQLRCEFIQGEKDTWSALESSRVCLFCLQRPPEHVLPCGHALCDTCVAIVGSRGPPAEYHFELAKCPLCFRSGSVVVRSLPPTRRPIILTLDGGGVRGVVTLGFLTALEARVGGSSGLREAVDLTVGTSAGAVIASEVMVRGTPVRDADAKFQTLARDIFPPRPRFQTPWGRSWEWLTTWMADSRYNSTALDEALQGAFGLVRRLFDPAAPLVSGSRVALTASRVEDGALGLLANYRGVGRPAIQSAYQALVPDGDEPLLWETARCSVAALGYFTPKTLAGIGTLQDGGVRANCPLRAALRESQIIWPSARRPDLVVSIGTGYVQDEPATPAEAAGRQPREGFIGRGLRTFLSSPAVDGHRGWEDALDSIPGDVRPDVFRLDRPITGPLPELDDVQALDTLGKFDYRIPDALIRAWLAKAFFFELDDEPIAAGGGYECHGSVLCGRPDAAGILCKIERRFQEPRVTLAPGTDLGAVDNDHGCRVCGYYRRRISFTVSSLQETVQVGISGRVGFSAIGGFPTSVQCLLDDQQADFPFGRADHRRDPWPPSRPCYCTGRKRAAPSADRGRAAKRRRLCSEQPSGSQ